LKKLIILSALIFSSVVFSSINSGKNIDQAKIEADKAKIDQKTKLINNNLKKGEYELDQMEVCQIVFMYNYNYCLVLFPEYK
jgi:predicted adenine nucleotide alpha hydrolase (AANH) superfamily ATPase